MNKAKIAFVFGLLFLCFSFFSADNTDDNWIEKSKQLRLDSIAKDLLFADFNQLKSMAKTLGLKDEENSAAYKKAIAKYYNIKLLESKSKDSLEKVILKRAGELKIYKHEDDEENMYIVGRVKLLLEMRDNENKALERIIEADEVFINKITKEITGIGNVYYKDDRLEYKGEQFFYNYEINRGVLFRGRTKLLKGGESGLEGAYFKGEKVVQTDRDDIILYNGMLTTCEEENPHYSLTVSRLWVSEKGEWGILNGVVYIGQTPFFYFPFYYHPKDLIINPAFGFRSKQGWYLNTTYYILGKKEADDSDLSSDVTARSLVNKMRKDPLDVFSITKTMSDKKLNEFYNRFDFYSKYPQFKIYPKFDSIDIALRVFTDLYTNIGFYTGAYFYLNVKAPSFPYKINFLSDYALSRKIWKDQDSDLYLSYNPADRYIYDTGTDNTYYNLGANPLLFRTSQWFKINGSLFKKVLNFDYDFQFEYISDKQYITDFYDRKLGFTYIDLLADAISYGVKSSTTELSAIKTKDESDLSSDKTYENTYTYLSTKLSPKQYKDIYGLKLLSNLSLNLESKLNFMNTDVSSKLVDNGALDPKKNRYLLYSFTTPQVNEFKMEGTLLDYDVFLDMPEKYKIAINKKEEEKAIKKDKKERDLLYLYIDNINGLDASTDKTKMDYMLILPLFSKKVQKPKAPDEKSKFKYYNLRYNNHEFIPKDEEEEDEKKDYLKDFINIANIDLYKDRTADQIKPIGFNFGYSLTEKLDNKFLFDTKTENPELDTIESIFSEEDRINFDEILKRFTLNSDLDYKLKGSLNFIKIASNPVIGFSPTLMILYTKQAENYDIYWEYLVNNEDSISNIKETLEQQWTENMTKSEFAIKYSDTMINDLSFGIYRIKGTGIKTDFNTDIFKYNEQKNENFKELYLQNKDTKNFHFTYPTEYYFNRVTYEKITKLESKFTFNVNILPEKNYHSLNMGIGPLIKWVIPSTEITTLKDELWEDEEEDIVYNDSIINEAKEYIYYRKNAPNLNDKINNYLFGEDFWAGAKYYRKMIDNFTYSTRYGYKPGTLDVVNISNDLVFKLDNFGEFSNLEGNTDNFTIYPDDIFSVGILNSLIKYTMSLEFKKVENSKVYPDLSSYRKKFDRYKLMTFENAHSFEFTIPGTLFSFKLPEGNWLSFKSTFDFKWDRTVHWDDKSGYNYYFFNKSDISLILLMDIFKIGLTLKEFDFESTGYGFELDSGYIDIGHKIDEIPIFFRYFKLELEPRIAYNFVVKHSNYYDGDELREYNTDYYDKNKLTFIFNIDLIIGKGTTFQTNIHFGVKSENKKMYEYYNMDAGVKRKTWGNHEYGLGAFFRDLGDSFNFSDTEARRQSPFNLQQIEFWIEHLLCDWKLTFKYLGKPEQSLIGATKGRYYWENTFEFYVTWAVKQENQLMKLLNKTKIEEKYEKGQWEQPVLSLDPNEN